MALRTPAVTCSHNAETQTRVPGRKVACRQCGATLEAEANAEGIFGPGSTNAEYPAASKPLTSEPVWEEL